MSCLRYIRDAPISFDVRYRPKSEELPLKWSAMLPKAEFTSGFVKKRHTGRVEFADPSLPLPFDGYWAPTEYNERGEQRHGGGGLEQRHPPHRAFHCIQSGTKFRVN
jgi:hypothetical protein